MNTIFQNCKKSLCLLLVLQLCATSYAQAQSTDQATVQNRNLQLEALQEDRVALYVLTIGVSDYADPRMNLRYANRDAEEIARAFAAQSGKLFDEVQTKVLVDSMATNDNIFRSIKTFLGRASKDDMVLIFMAGHGVQDQITNTYYFVPHNANNDNLISQGTSMQQFEEAIKRLQFTTGITKLMFWLDTCHAGAAGQQVAMRGMNVGEDLSQALKHASGHYVLSASKATEKSIEKEEWGHGAFTYSLLRGLKGEAADPATGAVWLSDLFSYVSREVPKLSEAAQHPHATWNGTDFPIFKTRSLQPTAAQIVAQPIAQDDDDQAITPVQQASSMIEPVIGPIPRQKSGILRNKWLWLLGGFAASSAAYMLTQDDPTPMGVVLIDIQAP